MSRELRYCASRSPHRVDIDFIDQGLHEFPGKLKQELLQALGRPKAGEYDYVLLNYGLCGNGTLGITHGELPVVIHAVHDCIPLLFGDSAAHREYTFGRPGTFWYSGGWIDGFPLPGGEDYRSKYREFYGRDINDAQRDSIERMLMQNYTHLSFIRWDELGEKVARMGREYTTRCVRSLNERLGLRMSYDELRGSPSILQKFVDGDWEGGDFVLLEPGRKLQFDPGTGELYPE
jgi:hypothetical protein